jgi:hypothetical protein
VRAVATALSSGRANAWTSVTSGGPERKEAMDGGIEVIFYLGGIDV